MNVKEWKCVGETVRGASHHRNGLPNQDAIYYRKQNELIVMAVADGHGSSKAFRSDIGSDLAVRRSADLLLELFSDQKLASNYSKVYDLIQQQLPERLVRSWIKAVNEEIQKHPFTIKEQKSLISKIENGSSRRFSNKLNPENEQELINRFPYGTTLLIVVVAKEFILYMQLGDGDILCVNKDGLVDRPLPEDKRLFGNETTSLCLPNAWTEFRIAMTPNSVEAPYLILVSSDGYANSFSSEEDFRQIGIDYLNLIKEEGIEALESDLPKILEETSAKGSGDDITLGIITKLQADRSLQLPLLRVEIEGTARDAENIEINSTNEGDYNEVKENPPSEIISPTDGEEKIEINSTNEGEPIEVEEEHPSEVISDPP